MNRSSILSGRLGSTISRGTFFGMLLGTVFAAANTDACPDRWNIKSCPQGMTPTGIGTCIDLFEWPNARAAKPMVGLSALPEARDKKRGLMLDADSLCKSAGKRACTREEWVSACKGPSNTKHVWGSSRPSKKPHPCNTDKWWRMTNETKIAMRDQREMARLDQSEPSGARESCRSWEHGAYDMQGNVEEWVTCPGIGIDGWCLMGRYWSEIRSCESTVSTHAARWHFYETSTRCCL